MTKSMTLVIPCYNEEKRLDLETFKAFIYQQKSVRFLFVNDGSKDNTLNVLKSFAQGNDQVEILDMPQNGGKAEAVRCGMLKALENNSDYIGFWDADLATPLDQLELFQIYLNKNAQIIMGSRINKLGSHVHRSHLRHYLGRIFATCASMILKMAVYDTQCGAKLFRRDIVESAFSEKFQSYWIFDVEILARLKYLNKLDVNTIYEVPLNKWRDVGGSKVRPFDFVKAPLELMAIYAKYKKNGY